MRRLNMWQRLGVVASGLWIIVGGIWQRTSDVARALKWAQSGYEPCSEAASQLQTGAEAANAKCMAEALHAHQIFLEGSWGNVVFVAIVPVLLGWLTAYLVLWLTRWVMAGRQNSN